MAINNSIGSKQKLDINSSPQFASIDIVSTTEGSHPVPSMTVAQRDAISSPVNGDMIFATDTSPSRPYVYDGDWEGLSYTSDIPNIPTLNQGQLIIGVDSSDPVAGYIISSDSSVNIDLSTNGEIDLTLNSGSGESLQDAYDAGNTIDISSGKPILFTTSTLGIVTNGVTTSSTGTNINSNYNIFGFTFVPSSPMFITSFQVEDSTLGIGQTRTLAIYEKSTGLQLVIGTVSKTDSLVGAYRTNSISEPPLLNAGTEYVLTTIVPPAQTYRNVNDAVAGAAISITEFASGDSQPFPIPMSPPNSYTATANVTPYGAFQYQLQSVESEFYIQNESMVGTFFGVKSTNRASIPAPVMTQADYNLIGTYDQGMLAFISDLTPTASLYAFDGANFHRVAYSDESGGGTFSTSMINISGVSSSSFINGMYSVPFVALQNTTCVTIEFSYVASATTAVLRVDVPVIVSSSFANSNQAIMMGQSVSVNVTPALGDGQVLSVTAVPGTSLVEITVLTANTTGTKVVTVSFMYIIT